MSKREEYVSPDSPKLLSDKVKRRQRLANREKGRIGALSFPESFTAMARPADHGHLRDTTATGTVKAMERRSTGKR